MTDYDKALNMPYNAWVNRQAALRDIKPSELEKSLDIKSMRGIGVGFASHIKAKNEFNAQVKDWDAVTDLREGHAGRFQVLGCTIVEAYVISGTAIKEK